MQDGHKVYCNNKFTILQKEKVDGNGAESQMHAPNAGNNYFQSIFPYPLHYQPRFSISKFER